MEPSTPDRNTEGLSESHKTREIKKRQDSMQREKILAVIRANIWAIIEGARGQSILETNSMRDFGADSLEIVEVTSRSMKQLGIRVPRSDLVSVSNIGELVDAFARTSHRDAVPA